MIPVREVIWSDRAESALGRLQRRRSKVATSIVHKVTWHIRRIEADAHACELIPPSRPRSALVLEQRHGSIDKLRCCDLPDGWRMLYTFYRVEGAAYAYILELVDHAQYSKWFPGRRKFGRGRA